MTYDVLLHLWINHLQWKISQKGIFLISFMRKAAQLEADWQDEKYWKLNNKQIEFSNGDEASSDDSWLKFQGNF